MTTPLSPQWTAPGSPGQLSNKRGSNTGADALSLQLKYANARSTGDPIAGLRIVATKPGPGGGVPVTSLDTWWLGLGTQNALPSGMGQPSGPASSISQYGGRVYLYDFNGVSPANGNRIYSAAVNGDNLGTWRQEATTNLPGNIMNAMTIVNGRIYLGQNANGLYYFATINGDGTLGAFSVANAGLPIVGNSNETLVSFSDSTGAWLIRLGGTVVTTTYAAPINADGTLGLWVQGSNLPAARVGAGIYIQAGAPGTCTIYMIGGSNLGSIISASFTGSTSVIGAWGALVNGLPAARTWPAIAVANGFIYAIGGSSTGAIGGGSTSIFFIAITALGGAWSTGTAIYPFGVSQVYAVGQAGNALGSLVGGVGTGGPVLLCIGGVDTASASRTVVELVQCNTTTGDAASIAAAAQGVELTNAQLGTGGSVVNNADGSISITYVWQTAVVGGGTLTDGDVVTLAAYATDQAGGDVSPLSVTVLKVGQPPTISNIQALPANNGLPTISFNFSAGAGGDLEFSYRIQLSPNGFDSGIRYDSANQIVVVSAPTLPTAVQQTVTVTVVSRDSPMTGSTATATLTLNFTPTITAPGTPSGLTVTPNHATGSVTLNWTNNAPAGTTPANRVYYRRNGTSTWFILFGSGAAITTATILDQLALAVGYDFAVSQLDLAVNSESALSNIISNIKIDPVVGGYSGFIHVQGAVTDQSQPIAHNAPLLVQNTPDAASVRDTTATLPFQQLTPVVTLGVAHYAKLELPILVPTTVSMKAIIDVLTTSYAGGVIVYRDGFGAMIACQIDPEQNAKYLPPVARYVTLKLTQIPNQFANSVAQGSAVGFLAQGFGSIIPLDSSEAIL